MIVTRFAPSPTGHLHLGHAMSALFAYDRAQKAGGKFLLRIEDIDPVRCKPQFIDSIVEDLEWLGLRWEMPVRLQSEHMDDYSEALKTLNQLDVVYPCFCTRSEIAAEAAAAAHAPQGPEGPIYPGTCRHLSNAERNDRMSREAPNWRLDAAKVTTMIGPLTWHDRQRGEMKADLMQFGDVVIARKDTPTSYHLSVTVDDHLQGVKLVTRGEDLIPSTSVHRYLQALLKFDVPDYEHHGLIKNASGQRLAKRDKAETLRSMREAGKSPEEVKAMAAVAILNNS